MYFDNIKYIALLASASRKSILDGDVRKDHIREKFLDIDYGHRYIPSVVESINKFNLLNEGDKPGSEFINDMLLKLDSDVHVAELACDIYERHTDYMNNIFSVVDDVFIRAIAELNDRLRTASSNEMFIPYVQGISRSKTYNCYRTMKAIYPEPVIKDIIDYSDISIMYEGNAAISGDLKSAVFGKDVSFVSDYSASGMKIKLVMTSAKQFNSLVIGISDGMKHNIKIDGKSAMLSGAIVYKGNYRDSVVVEINTSEFTNDEKHLLIIDFIQLLDVDYFKSAVVEMENDMVGVTPMGIYPVNEGVYSGNGSVVMSIFDGKWKGFSNYRNGSNSGYYTQIASDKSSQEYTITPEIESVTITNADRNRIYGLYGKKDDLVETPNGYKQLNGKKYSFAYLDGTEDLTGVNVYKLSGEYTTSISPGAYVVEYDNSVSFDVYGHCTANDEDISIENLTMSIPLELEKDISYEYFIKNGIEIPDAYSVSGDDMFSKPDFFDYGLFEEEDIDISGSTATISTGTFVQPGTKSKYGLVAFVCIGNRYYYPWEVDLNEPFSEDGSDVELGIEFSLTDYEGEDVQYYILRSKAQQYNLSKDNYTYFYVNCEEYLGDIALVPITEEKMEFEYTINNSRSSEIETPFTGRMAVGIKPSSNVSLGGVAVIPVIPEYVISEVTDYILNYEFLGIKKEILENELDVDYSVVDDNFEVCDMDRTFRIKIKGNEANDAYIKYERLDSDSALIVYETPKTFDPKIKLEINSVSEGFQPVVTNPVIGVVLI